MGTHDQRRRVLPHLLLTDEPGVMVHNPRRQLARLLVLYAVLPLICAAAGAFIAYSLSSAEIDRRVTATERQQADYLAERRRLNAEGDRLRDEQLAQFRRDLCVLIDRAVPRDLVVDELRRRYGCTGPTATAPTSPTPRPTGPAGQRGTASGGSPGGGTVPARPQPGPTSPQKPPAGPPGPVGPSGPPGPTAPAPAPAPAPSGLLCLPVLDLCVL
jgi:hypothetical protein